VQAHRSTHYETAIMTTLPITILIAAKNEAPNMLRCLRSARWAQDVYVIDSGSEDGTIEIAERSGAKVVQFRYTGGYPKKRQWALDTLNLTTPWILLLDADEIIPEALWEEIAKRIAEPAYNAFLITKGFHFLGRPFRFGGFSHAAVLLFRRGTARFERTLMNPPSAQDMEVHERLIVEGGIGRLRTPLIHEDFKGLKAYVDRHNQYSTWEALLRRQYRSTGAWGADSVKARLWGNSQEQRRWLKAVALRVPFEPQLWFVYHYFLRLAFLEGRPGLIASRLRANYIADVHAKMYELEERTAAVEENTPRVRAVQRG
jgi:glycosyltransferase involved in cell wall biosynthesis